MKFKFYKKVLKNGMTILFEKRDTPVVSVAFAIRCGGINEKPSEKGISHFIEHLLYKGTTKRSSKQIAEEIERNGGILNGFTGETVTAFWCKMPHDKIDIALDVLGDMVRNPKFDEKEIDKERHVIFEEIKMIKDSPSNHSMHEIQKCLYEPTLGLSIIGSVETLSSITRKRILERFEETYQPSDMILSVVGDADFNKIVKFAEKNFVSKKKSKIPSFKVKEKNQNKIEKRKGIDQANIIFAYHIPKSKDKKSYAAFLLNSILADGMSSRLFHEVREKRNLAYSIGGSSDINKEFSYSIIHAGTKKENVEPIRRIILGELKKVSESLEKKEFEAVKNQVIGNHKISTEDSQNQMVSLLLHELNGDATETYKFEENMKKVKLEDVKKLAKLKKYSFFALVPE